MQKEGYTHGEAQIYSPRCDYDCWGGDAHAGDCGRYHSDEFEGSVFLPHSCQEWIIGSPEQVRALIADLQALLK